MSDYTQYVILTSRFKDVHDLLQRPHWATEDALLMSERQKLWHEIEALKNKYAGQIPPQQPESEGK